MFMNSLFPSDVGMSHVRGVVKIIKENGGNISISKLAEESEEDVDDLLQLLDACRLLGFIKVTRSRLKLTDKGETIIKGSSRSIIRQALPGIEPFKSVIKALSGGSKTTYELVEYLKEKGLLTEKPEVENEKLINLLRVWGVRSKLLSYDEESESWMLIG